MRAKLTAIILTFNEALHIERCISSVRGIASDILVVDSFSTDETVALAIESGARVLQHPFVNYSAQLNWAINQVPPESEWVLRIDADEYLTRELAEELRGRLDDLPQRVTGLIVRRRIRFLGGRVRFGGFGGLSVLRFWRSGCAHCESRWMDEHMSLVSGEALRLEHSLVDDNLNDIAWWTRKHLGYASREAVDLLNVRHGIFPVSSPGALGVKAAEGKRFLKERLYARLPLGVRPVLYYLVRMTIQLGFLDSASGWAFHFLQGFWYRTLVDIRVWEVERRMRDDGVSAIEAIRTQLGIDPLAMASPS